MGLPAQDMTAEAPPLDLSQVCNRLAMLLEEAQTFCLSLQDEIGATFSDGGDLPQSAVDHFQRLDQLTQTMGALSALMQDLNVRESMSGGELRDAIARMPLVSVRNTLLHGSGPAFAGQQEEISLF